MPVIVRDNFELTAIYVTNILEPLEFVSEQRNLRYLAVVDGCWLRPSRRRFVGLCAAAPAEFVPGGGPLPDSEAFAKAIRRRYTWLARNCDGAVLVRRADDRTPTSVDRQLESVLHGDVWVIEPD